MLKLLQIADSVNWGSVGRIASQIGDKVIADGGKSYIAYGRYSNPSNSKTIKIGSRIELYFHVLCTRIFDIHGLCSIFTTIRLIRKIKKINPDIIHLHQIHGYFLNYPILFRYLQISNIPVVWTLHDCWLFTGHCSHFESYGCLKWQEQCYNCPLKKGYPTSLLFDNSKLNYFLKKKYFSSLENNLILIPVSLWLEKLVRKSFLKNTECKTIHNGIDLNVFRPKNLTLGDSKIYTIMGCAMPWSEKKGFKDFIKLRSLLPLNKYKIIMVGLTKEQVASLPKGIKGIERTQNVQELASLYSNSDVFVNTTYEDNYPTVNLEAIACGTPVITYDTGGSSESITEKTGIVIDKGNLDQLVKAIYSIEKLDRDELRMNCREHAVNYFDRNKCFNEYLDLYNDILKRKINKK